MTFLWENQLLVASAAALATLIALMIALGRRTLAALVGLGATLVAAALLILLERWIVTPSEQIQQRLSEVLDAIEANDADAVVAAIDARASAMQQEAAELMRRIDVEKTGATKIRVEFDNDAPSSAATVHFRGLLQGRARQGGFGGAYFDNVDVHWVLRDGTWYMDDYTAYHRGQPIDARRETLR